MFGQFACKCKEGRHCSRIGDDEANEKVGERGEGGRGQMKSPYYVV